MDGTYEDYGFLLEQGQIGFTKYYSSEYGTLANRPKLELCYATAAGTECVTFQRGIEGTVYDTDILSATHSWGSNFGSSTWLHTGLFPGEKQTLIRFDMEQLPPELASIGDYVWLDANEDGIQDVDEVGYPGATVNLYDCTEALIATTVTDATGYYLFDDLTPGDYHVVFVLPEGYVFSPQDQGGDDAMDSDADQVTGAAACTTLDPGEHDPTWDAGIYAPVIECDECDGKITSLTLEYQGAAEAFVEVFAKGHHGDQGEVLFSGQVLPGANFMINGYDKNGTVGTEIHLSVGGVFNTQIHTSCSQPIYIGMVSGDFEILDGYSRHGGRLCPGDGGGSNGGGDECSDCEGKITELTLAYSGAADATIEVYSKGKRGQQGELLFSGPVLPGANFMINGYDKNGTVGTEIHLSVGGVFNTQIHTSCSQPIYIGMVSGDFEILDGYSKKGGQICPMQ